MKSEAADPNKSVAPKSDGENQIVIVVLATFDTLVCKIKKENVCEGITGFGNESAPLVILVGDQLNAPVYKHSILPTSSHQSRRDCLFVAVLKIYQIVSISNIRRRNLGGG